MERKDVWIAGGGLAGLTAAIHLARRGVSVGVIEKHPYPRHKVCGEYLSREVLPYLESLDIDIKALGPHPINRLELTSPSGKSMRCKLPLGGLGLSRFALDAFLAEKAAGAGCQIVRDSVSTIHFTGDSFQVRTANGAYEAAVALGACGKRSSLDAHLQRDFFKMRTPWLAVKAHYDSDFPDGLVGLHHFPGGYAGLSKTETGAVNFCYLAHTKNFSAFGNIENFTANVVCQNPDLARFLKNAKLLFEPLAISQISFAPKPAVENHVLMLGDMAGVIHPLCGNGMAMAILGAKLAAENVLSLLDGKITREMMETHYARAWQSGFSYRLWAGRRIAAVFRHARLTDLGLQVLSGIPSVLRGIVRSTHGNPIYT